MDRMWAAASAVADLPRHLLKAFASLQNCLSEPVRRNDRGVTAVEYAFLLLMISGVVAAAIVLFGHKVRAVFSTFSF